MTAVLRSLAQPAARVLAFNPRRSRDFERGRRAAAAEKAAGRPAIDQMLAQIDETFSGAAVVNALKMRVERSIRLAHHYGPGHPELQARYGARARRLQEIIRSATPAVPGLSLIDQAIAAVERWYRAERKAFQIGAGFGRANSLSLEVLKELRLLLRLGRRKLVAWREVSAAAAVRGGDHE